MRLGDLMTEFLEDDISDGDEPGVPPAAFQQDEGESPAETNAADAGCDAPETGEDVDGPESGAGFTVADGELTSDDSLKVEQAESCTDQATLHEVVKRIDDLESLFRAKISRSEYEEQVLKRYSDEIHEYRGDLYKKITLPLIKEIIGVRDAACSMVEQAHIKEETTVDIDSVEFICDMLETALGSYGVTVRRPEVGRELEKGLERPVGRVKTATIDEHGTIADFMNDSYLMDGKCISPAKVKVFVYDESLCSGAEAQQPSARFDADDETQASIAGVGTNQDSGMPVPAPVYKPERD